MILEDEVVEPSNETESPDEDIMSSKHPKSGMLLVCCCGTFSAYFIVSLALSFLPQVTPVPAPRVVALAYQTNIQAMFPTHARSTPDSRRGRR